MRRLAPGTTAGLVPGLITGWARPDRELWPLDVVGMVLVVGRATESNGDKPDAAILTPPVQKPAGELTAGPTFVCF